MEGVNASITEIARPATLREEAGKFNLNEEMTGTK